MLMIYSFGSLDHENWHSLFLPFVNSSLLYSFQLWILHSIIFFFHFLSCCYCLYLNKIMNFIVYLHQSYFASFLMCIYLSFLFISVKAFYLPIQPMLHLHHYHLATLSHKEAVEYCIFVLFIEKQLFLQH